MEFMHRGVYRAQVTKIVNAANEYLSLPNSRICPENLENLDLIEEELSAYVERLSLAHENLIKANSDMKPLIKSEEFQKEVETVPEYDDKATAMKARLTQRLNKAREAGIGSSSFSQVEVPENSRTRADNSRRPHQIKLPKLELKKFSGKHGDWLPFWEQYKSTIHENPVLSSIEKFNYLQSLLIGKAGETIAGFTPSEACYDAAIALLLEEFGATEKILDRNLQHLMALKPVSSRTDATGLRRLYNEITAATRSLTALGVPLNNYSIMLKSIVLKCLPEQLRVDYHRLQQLEIKREQEDISTAERDNADSESVFSFKSDHEAQRVLRFLKREIESLESSLVQIDGNKRAQTKTASIITSSAAGLFASATNAPPPCCFCKSGAHAAENCDRPLSIAQKKELLKAQARCFRCFKRGHITKQCRVRNLSCKNCSKGHASAMCTVTPARDGGASENKPAADANDQKVVNLSAVNATTNIYLQTACVFASSPNRKRSLYIRIVLDGGSQKTFIRESVSRKLELPVLGTQKLSIMSFGCNKQSVPRICNVVRVILKSQFDSQCTIIEAVEVPDICADILIVPTIKDPELDGLSLADSRPFKFAPEEGISLLIGADSYWSFVTGEHRRLTERLTAIKTVFGWTLQGPSPVSMQNAQTTLIVPSLQLCVSTLHDIDVTKLWDLELLGVKEDKIEDEEFTMKYLKDCLIKKDGRYEACLPWRDRELVLDDNFNGALQRLSRLIRKLSLTGKLQEYIAKMEAFIAAGYAEIVREKDNASQKFYMPHRPVYREDKATTKVRIVFDGSAHAEGSLSLNQCLLPGANLLSDVLLILLNFRLETVALIADIEKAFLQILLAPKDRDSHRFIWYINNEEPMQHNLQVYRMTRITFGVASSPFILGATIKAHLNYESMKYPETCEILGRSFYMDDLILSIDTVDKACRIVREATEIMSSASMVLRKWNSNNKLVRKQLPYTNPPEVQKVLGIIWHTLNDELTVDLRVFEEFIQQSTVGTKRILLQALSRIYDPLGWLSPWTIKMKVLFQDIWRQNLDWDSELPHDLAVTWRNCCSELQLAKEIVLPRCISAEGQVIKQIHIFFDASPKAYGVVCYVRSVSESNAVLVRLFCAKSRVAPLKKGNGGDKHEKQCTLPRLEP